MRVLCVQTPNVLVARESKVVILRKLLAAVDLVVLK